MTAKTADELYAGVVRRLPLQERLRLAALILNDALPALTGVEESEAWSEEDLRDATIASWWYANQAHEED